MRIIIAFLSFVGFLLPCQVNAQTSYADVDDFWDHVSPGTYDPADSLLYGAPSTSDAYSAWQWNMRQILEGESYDSLFVDAPRTVKVAVIGMFPGCDDHPDLDDICLPGKNYIEGTTDTSPTWDGKTATRSNRHDQCVVSIIAAEHNSIGVAGVAAMARVIPIRTDFDHLAEAINWAISQGAEVIHIPSLVGTDDQRFAMWPALFDPDNARYRPLYESASKAATLSQKIYELRQTINEASFNGVIISTVVNNWSGEISIKMEGAMGETISTQAVNALGEPSPFISTAYFTDMLAPGGDRREFTTSLSYPSDFVIETKYADARRCSLRHQLGQIQLSIWWVCGGAACCRRRSHYQKLSAGRKNI